MVHLANQLLTLLDSLMLLLEPEVLRCDWLLDSFLESFELGLVIGIVPHVPVSDQLLSFDYLLFVKVAEDWVIGQARDLKRVQGFG